MKTKLLLFVSLIVVIFCGYSELDCKEVRDYTARQFFEMGIAFYNGRNYTEALNAFMQALNIDPKHKEARNYLKKTAEGLESNDVKNQTVIKELGIEDLYSKAVRDFDSGHYLSANEIFLNIAKYKKSGTYLKKISINIGQMIKDKNSTDLEKTAYAEGYTAYFSSDMQKAMNEWGKVININPNNDEVALYLARAKKAEHGQEVEKKVQGLFSQGEGYYRDEKYTQAISKWENVIDISKKEKLIASSLWEKNANDKIELALKNLQSIVKKREKTRKKESLKSDEIVLNQPDFKKAEEYYVQGLVLYANGRLRDAVRNWETTLRMNPNHEKAKKSMETALAELKD